MGNGSDYIKDGGFLKYDWEKERTIEGIDVLRHKFEKRSDLPKFSNTAKAYFKEDGNHEVIQLRFYDDRLAVIDIDIMPSQNHINKVTKEKFPAGVLHIHDWGFEDGKWRRLEEARYMTDAEIAKYGDLIRKANPNVRFRP